MTMGTLRPKKGIKQLAALIRLGICTLVAASILWVAVWLPPEQKPAAHPPGGPGDAVPGVKQETNT
jgi:hypothetical protein